ncbi:EcKinase 11 [Microplitis demolitor]|uniref:uncharacterized LOC103569084 n=1 Tax=Microplitis demolitor TaxID=69319 RepID=UPI0004CCB42D|nr:uncharacterized LOC103569084 [Microplitis demolitor]KAG6558436.1 EcKinase 11 [Microplitis demolitor]
MTKPEWLTAQFIENILKNSEKDNSIFVKKISIENATNKGDNYASAMYRVNFEFICNRSDKKIEKKNSLIVKVAHIYGIWKKVVKGTKVIFNTESSFMASLMKDMEIALENTKLGPRFFYYQENNPLLLVMEDLTPLGFRMADRQARLDIQHCTLALQRLAKFHASSVLVCENTPEYKGHYTNGKYSNNIPEITSFFRNGMKFLVEEIKTWPEINEEFFKKLNQLVETAYEKACEIGKLRENEFNVINHGDFWVNNMLFKYDDNHNVVDQIFIDFQFCHYGTPALDLLHFLNTSASEKVLIHHKHSLIEEYVKTLSTTMKIIGCQTCPPSLDYIQKVLIEKEFIGFVITCTSLPVNIMDKNQAQNYFDEILSTGDVKFKTNIYHNEVFKKIMVRRLQEWNALGIFDR